MRLIFLLLSALAALAAQAGAATGYGPYEQVRLVGAAVVSEDDARVLADGYAGRLLTIDDLRALADGFTEPCARAALALCRAEIPDPDPGAPVLTVHVSEGHVADLVAPTALLPVARRVLAPVLAERPLRRETLTRAVTNLGEVPGVRLASVTPERLEGHAYRLVIEGDYERTGLRGYASNRGSRRDHPWQGVAAASRRSLLVPGDEAQMAYVFRPEAPSELSYGVLKYRTAPLASGRTLFGEANLSRNSPRAALDGRNVEGSLARVIFGARSPIFRRTGRQLHLETSFEAVGTEEREDGAQLFRDDLRVLRAALIGQAQRGESLRLAPRVVVSQGVDGLGARVGSRPDGRAGFTTLAADLLARAQIGRLHAEGAVTAQVSSAPLPFQEEFSLGGGEFGRAYDFGEVRGDAGIAAYVEAGPRLALGGGRAALTPYLFVDAGAIWQVDLDTLADGKPLWSAGLGVDLAHKSGLVLGYEAAFPLSNAPYTAEDDVRHRLQLGWSQGR